MAGASVVCPTSTSGRGAFFSGVVLGGLLAVVLPEIYSYVCLALRRRRSAKTGCRRRGPTASPASVREVLCQRLFGEGLDPFATTPRVALPEDHSYPHTNLPVKFVADLFHALKPEFLVEVGSFKGGSALILADCAAKASQTGGVPCLLCVDTFLGDTAMWLNRNVGWRDWLMQENGLPQIYWQFLANTYRKRDIILPLPLASLCAMRALQELVAKEDVPAPLFMYLDSAHEKGESLLEITQAFRLLAPGGILLGDDLDWPAVESDLKAFLSTNPAVARDDDPFLLRFGCLHYCDEGYWVVDVVPRQWLIRKAGGTLDDLRRALDSEVHGEVPAEYIPLTDNDRTALRLYEEGVTFTDQGDMKSGIARMKEAAAISSSVAAHFGL